MWKKTRLSCLKPLLARGLLAIWSVGVASAISTVSNAEPPKVARWVDADGVVQFGHPQFAPADHDTVSIEPANGMEPPTYFEPADARQGPVVHQLDRNHTSNKRGFRGHYNRRNQGTRNR